MNQILIKATLCLLSSFVLSFPIIQPVAAYSTKTGETGSPYHQLVDRYFETYFKGNPSEATYVGYHQYDHQIEDYSEAGIRNDIAQNKLFLAAFEKLNPKELSALDGADRELLINTLKAQLLEAEQIRNWQKNPDIYSSGIISSVYTLMSRKFAPAEVRLKAATARLEKMPVVLVDARKNLKNPPKIFTEVALAQLPGNIDFLAKDLPAAFAEVKDPVLWKHFNQANQKVIQALQDYEKWLQNDLLPQSHGDYRLGETLYRQKLLYDEMVDLPLDQLLEVGYQDLRKNQMEFQAIAKQLDPSKSPQEILADLNKNYPPPSQLLESFRQETRKVKDFIEQKQIVTIPSQVFPRIEETPPFMRALTFASMDTPGPFEKNATEAYFNVTLPESSWPEADIADYMAGFNYGTIASTAIHEAYPGHYVQFLWVPNAVSKVRKLLGASSNIEGWAHYCEQMILDQGYGQGNLTIKLGQLQDALLRNARYVVGIELHTGKMSFEEAVDFFVSEGYQTRINAEREVERGTSDPTYLYYTLGKLQIQKLHADYKRLKGASYSLRQFHDDFLRQGYPPIKLVRRALLGSDGELL